MFSGIDNVRQEEHNDPLPNRHKEIIDISEILTRLQDLENRLPTEEAIEPPLPLLSDSASLAEVINMVNQLVKRDLNLNKVK